MNIKEINRDYGRHFLVVAAIFVWALIIHSFFVNGYIETWYKWHFPAKMPPFSDFRLIPSSAEAFRMGLDPSVTNPTNPRGHLFNYPKAWYIFFFTGITQDDTIWIVTTMLVTFFLVLFAFPEKLSVLDALLMLGLCFSPAAMLLYERGNVDMAMFTLCGAVILLARKMPWWAVLTLSVAAIFKLFPFFGIGIFLRENRKDFYKYALACALLLGVYLALTYQDLSVAWNLTQRGTYLSYGDQVIFTLYWAYLRYYLLRVMSEEQIVSLLAVLPHVAALGVLVFSYWIGAGNKQPLTTKVKGNLDAFRMGAFIFIGTFLLGNNWDYRLVFLIFTIPQLSGWLFDGERPVRPAAFVVLLSILASCWYTTISKYFFVLSDSRYGLGFATYDEIANWLVFAGLTYFIAWSAPQWVRSWAWKPFFMNQQTAQFKK